MKASHVYISLILLFFLALAAPSSALAADVGDSVPGFVLEKTDGTVLRTDALKGKKPLMLVFWATWCPSCKVEIPRLKEVHAALKPRGLELIAVNVGVNDSLNKTKRFMKKYDITYPVGFDEGSRITTRFKILGTPTVIIVDRSGVVRYRSSGVPVNLEENFNILMN